MPLRMDPEILTPGRGKLIVRIVERSDQTSPLGLLIVPNLAEDQQHLRDTATGRVMKIGAPPRTKHVFSKKEKRLTTVPNSTRSEWPDEYLGLREGTYVVFPRDVPLVFTWGEDQDVKRYAIIMQDELLFSFVSDDYGGESYVPTRQDPEVPDFDRDLEYEVEDTLRKM